MLLNSNLINWYYANNYSNKSDLTVNISKTFLEEIPIKIVKECTVFTQIADHLMFLFRYYNIESENAASYYKMLQYFLNLGSAIVYELYFMKFIKTRLTEIIENCLIPINFNEWAIQKLKIRQVLRKKKHLEELEEKNLRIIRDNYNQLIRNDELWKNLDRINNHEFVKYIEGGF